MEFKYGNLVFSSNFDSGNLLNVERITCSDENSTNQLSESNKPDYEFNVWTKPDGFGTEFENGNRTWFYFSVKGYSPNKIIKITIKNLNRQQRLYSQGYCPLFRTESSNGDNNKWLRVRFRPTWETTDNNFQLTFLHRFSELKNSVTYFAFCYPWSYKECQKQLEDLDSKFSHVQFCDWERLSKMEPATIYYNRELLTNSLDGRRIDLLTITDLVGLQDEREEEFDSKLFPIAKSRPWRFANKKVFFVTSRVHPGETPASHVFNGFLEFILRPDDIRSCQLRRQFIFKLIPLLNPDGVFRGHYRTDTRGVNLNRVYLYPDFKLHPSIYAAKSLLVYYHIVNSIVPIDMINTIKSNVFGNIKRPPCDDRPLNVIPISRNHKNTVTSDYALKSNKNPNEIELSSCEDHNDDIIGMHYIPTKENVITPVQILPKERIVDSATMDDYLEVLVDVGNNKPELYTHPTTDENKKNESEVQLDQKNEYEVAIKDPESHSSNNRVVSENNIDSIYKFSKVSASKRPEFVSKSIDCSQKPISDYQWNVKHLQLSNPTNNLHQLVRPYKKFSSSMIPLPLKPAIVSMKFSSKKMNKITINSAQLSKIKRELQLRNGFKSEPKIGNEGSDDDSEKDCVNVDNILKFSIHLSDPSLLNITPDKSGIAFYIDLHGHCSKRGCFIYGNCLESENEMIANVLYPKLISLNSAHFDFSGCNFSVKNMYTRDKRDGNSKEGAGRVAIWKHLGIIHSYTLECNYNTGRIVNAIVQISKDDGRSSPPSNETSTLLAPRYTPYHFEDVGKAMAISALDIYSTNPLSRVMNSEYNNLNALCEYLRKYLSNQKLGIRTSYTLKNRVFRQNKTQPSNSSISSNSKPYPTSSENRRINYSQNSISLSGSRKSQSSQIHRLPNQKFSSNSKLPTKPVFSNEVILNSYQLDILQKDAKLESSKSQITPINNHETDYSHTKPHLNSNVNSSISRSTDGKTMNKKSITQAEKISCDSSNIGIRNQNQETLSNMNFTVDLSKERENSLKSFNNNMPKLQNHNESKTLLPLRRNSIANCYFQNLVNDNNLVEKEKRDKLNEILSEELCYNDNPPYYKTYSFNYTDKSHGARKNEVKNKKLGKLISYSANDIHY